MDIRSSNLAVRALNHWRTQYMPSYLALRLLVEQLPKSKGSNYLEHFLIQKMSTGEVSRYRQFRRFKGLSSRGDMEYRSFYAASPTSALAEAYILKLLSKVEALTPLPCVFSYRWPRSDSEGGSYRYFMPGYKARQRQVTSLLRTNPGCVVLVHDIQSFYPSVSKEVVSKRLQEHLTNSQLSLPVQVFVEFCEKFLSMAEGGIPIGPALSHIFGNIALEPVDMGMCQLMEGHYLRYVDDILMIVERNKINAVQSKLGELIEAEGFQLHDELGKRDLIEAQDWLANISTDEEQLLGRRFDDLRSRIRLFLNRGQDELASLQNLFKDAGIPMPVQRLAEEAGYGRFLWFMRPWVRESRQSLRQFLSRFRSKQEEEFITSVSKLRVGFVEAAKRIDVSDARKQGMIRRLRIQRLRYILYRLLYLTPIDQYQSLLDLTPSVGEFYEYRSLIEAILSRRLDTVLQIPGPTLGMFASLCRELGLEGCFQYDERALEPEGALDSICTLSAFGLITVPNSWISKLAEPHAETVRFCLFFTPLKRTLNDSSFEDEIRTLQLGKTEDQMRHIVNTRFDDVGRIDLEDILFSEYMY